MDLLYAACAMWIAIALPFSWLLIKDRGCKPWVKTLTEDLKPRHPDQRP